MMTPVYRIQLVKDKSVAYRATINNASDAVSVARKLLEGSDRERVVAVMLDVRNQVIGATEVSVGTVSASLVHPREAFKAAILLNASALILAHNHPSGELSPSAHDEALTTRLVECGKLLGIEVLDHVIVAGGAWMGLRESHPELWRGKR